MVACGGLRLWDIPFLAGRTDDTGLSFVLEAVALGTRHRAHVPHELRRPNQFLFLENATITLDADVFALPWVNAAGKPATLRL